MPSRLTLAALLALPLVAACDPGLLPWATPQPDAGASPTSEPVVVAFVGPGDDTFLGELAEGWRASAQLAADLVNEGGGVHEGRAVDLRFFAHDDTSAEAAREQTRLALEAGARAIIGPTISATARSVLAVLEEEGVPAVSGTATSPELSDEELLFRTLSSETRQAEVLADIATSDVEEVQACKQAAVVAREDAYGSWMADAFVARFESLGGTLIAQDTFEAPLSYSPDEVAALELQAGNLALQISSNRDADVPFCMVIFGFPPALDPYLGRLLSALSLDGEAGLPEAILTGDAAVGASFEPFSAPLFATSPTHGHNAAYDAFATLFEEELGRGPRVYDAFVFDAASLAFSALTAADPDEATAVREAILEVSREGTSFDIFHWEDARAFVEAGEDFDLVGATGALDLDDQGEAHNPWALVALGEDGEWDVVELFGVEE